MIDRPHRVVVVLTHPVQYFSPWFRFIHEHTPQIDLRVLYAVQPSAEAQGVGFGQPFEWDRPLLDGYAHQVLSPGRGENDLGAARFSTVDAPALNAALLDHGPDFVLVPGWHAAFYRRAMRLCRRDGIPTLYRGDSTLLSAPRSALGRTAWSLHTKRRLCEYTAYLSVGTRSREYLEAFGMPEPLTFDSPHAVDNIFFGATPTSDRRSLREQYGLEPRLFTVLFAGKLEPKKRPIDVVRAMAGVPAQLVIAGAGPLEADCRREAARVGISAVFTGVLSQRAIRDVLGTVDCVALPSDGRETWGLVVNEALAAGVPVVVSDQVGCQPDLVIEGQTGAAFPMGDIPALRDAIDRVRICHEAGHAFAAACRAHAATHSYARATDGLIAACTRLARQRRAAQVNQTGSARVLAACGHMVTPGGLERMTFDVLATLRSHGAGVHCLVNKWGSSRIVALAEHAGVSWSVGRSDVPLRRRPASLAAAALMVWEVVRTSIDVVAARVRHRATHVLVPDFLVTVRAWPALVALRMTGCRVILRVGMAPPVGRFYIMLWRSIVNSAVDRVICNSEFLLAQSRGHGIPDQKLRLIRNAAMPRGDAGGIISPGRVLYIGQIIPDKGVDLLIEAIAELRRSGIPATLDVAGDMGRWESPTHRGYRDRLRSLAADPTLNGAVRFLGYREDVAQLLSSAVVHCLPSRNAIREGMANVVLEAKTAAVPSVVTKSGSLPELVQHGVDGWIADDNASSIAEGLRYFLQDPVRRKDAGEAARRSLKGFARNTFETAWLDEFHLSAAALRIAKLSRSA